jgi:3-mercaptopyruvate sulfurtransferase SseA
MERTLSISSRTGLALGATLALGLLAGGCGDKAGTSAYRNPVAPIQSSGAIIDAATLASWADEGKINAALGIVDRVVLVSVTTPANFTSTTKRHIPDALLLDYSSELTMVREEGLGPAATMMLGGPQMDALVRKLGIDGHTTVVLTYPRGTTDSDFNHVSVAYWTFRYWGFDRDRIKILNGGDDAWDVAGQPLTDAVVAATPSTYSVSGNTALKAMFRYSVGEMLGVVDGTNRDRAQLETLQMLDVRGFTASPYLANSFRGSGNVQFINDRVNGEASRNRLFPDRATLITRLASSPVKNGTADTFLSPSKKTIVMCGSSTNAAPSFVLFDAVLAVPEGDVGMYDGSSSQWTNYSFAKIRAAGATESQANAWAFDVVTPGTSSLRAVGTLPAPVAGENPFLPGTYLFAPAQTEVNQIEAADHQYVTSSGGSPSPSTPVGSPGGGC